MRWGLVGLVLAAIVVGVVLVTVTLLEATFLAPDREALAFAFGLQLLIVGLVMAGLMLRARWARGWALLESALEYLQR